MTQEPSIQAPISETVAKILSLVDDAGAVQVTHDPAYGLSWFRQGEVVIGLITGYEGAEEGEFALLDRHGNNWSGDDFALTSAEATDAVVGYLEAGEPFGRDQDTEHNVFVSDGSPEELDCGLFDLSGGIDTLLKNEVMGCRASAFDAEYTEVDWDSARIFVRLEPVPGESQNYGSRYLFEGDAFEKAVLGRLGDHLEVSVLLSEQAVRECEGCDDDDAVAGILEAVQGAVETWLNRSNPIGAHLAGANGAECEIGYCCDEDEDGEHYVEVAVKLDDWCDKGNPCLRDRIFIKAAEPLEDSLVDVVSEAVAKAVAAVAARTESL